MVVAMTSIRFIRSAPAVSYGCGTGLPFLAVTAVVPTASLRVHSDGAGCALPQTGSARYICLLPKH